MLGELNLSNERDVFSFQCFYHSLLHFGHCVQQLLEEFDFPYLTSIFRVIMDTGFSITAKGKCCDAILAAPSAKRLQEVFDSEFWCRGVSSTICRVLLCDTNIDKRRVMLGFVL